MMIFKLAIMVKTERRMAVACSDLLGVSMWILCSAPTVPDVPSPSVPPDRKVGKLSK
jgi:hypothetical protein